MSQATDQLDAWRDDYDKRGDSLSIAVNAVIAENAALAAQVDALTKQLAAAAQPPVVTPPATPVIVVGPTGKTIINVTPAATGSKDLRPLLAGKTNTILACDPGPYICSAVINQGCGVIARQPVARFAKPTVVIDALGYQAFVCKAGDNYFEGLRLQRCQENGFEFYGKGATVLNCMMDWNDTGDFVWGSGADTILIDGLIVDGVTGYDACPFRAGPFNGVPTRNVTIQNSFIRRGDQLEASIRFAGVVGGKLLNTVCLGKCDITVQDKASWDAKAQSTDIVLQDVDTDGAIILYPGAGKVSLSNVKMPSPPSLVPNSGQYAGMPMAQTPSVLNCGSGATGAATTWAACKGANLI